MTEEAERLYEQALALPAASRVAFVRDACADRPALGDELVSLLAHAGVAERFFDHLGGVVRSAVPAVEPDPTPDDPMFGCVVGRFRITALLGRGGMGAVYRARDQRLDRDVALKFLPPQEALSPGAVERFLIEARAAGTLSHPNVCTIHEVGETADGRPYIAMALYEGETLRQRIARGALPARDAAVIARDIARALGAAHSRGIVHRDVKPGNVILGRDGVTRLLDFGLARFSDSSITGTGSAPGTIAYMSPEQVNGAALDHRSDLWSLGVVLHEMLAGRRPFQTGGERAIVLAIVQDAAPSLADVQPPVPPALQRIVERLMRKSPDERYRDAAELESDLDAFIAGHPTATSSPSSDAPYAPRRAPRRVLIAAIVLGVLAVATALSVVSQSRGGTQAPPIAHSLAVLPFVELSGDTANRYFSDGLSEEIITRLGRIAGLRVAARSSAFALRGRSLDARQIGDTLGVDALLEGSVRRAGLRLRVSARLVDAESGLQLWADEYDREMSDVLTVQDEIARAIANALALRMPAAIAGVVARGRIDPEAYDLYLHALTLRSQLRPDAMRRAVELLDRAIERQPDFALAWAAKASVVAPLVFYGQIPAQQGLPVVRAAIDRAFALDPQSGEAYASRGMLQLFWEWDWAGAGRTLRQATVLNPSDAHAWHHLGNYLRAVNRLDEAAAARLRGLTLDPLDARLQNSLGEDYLSAGRLAEARAAFERGSQLDPLHPIQLGLGPGAPHGVWNVLLAQGREADAVAELLRVAALRGATADEAQALRAAFATAGMHGFWRRWLVMDERQSNGRSDSMRVATLRALAGDSTGALDILERAFASQSPAIIFIRTEPAFAALRTHPRFVRIVEGMHFPSH